MSKTLQIEKLKELDYAKKEAYNSLRTNLQFCGDDIKTILLTSCTPNEGKSTIAMMLGQSIADSGQKVLVIDADLRKSVLVGRHGIKGESEIKGLSHYLSGQEKLESVIYNTNIKNMDMILAGPVAPNPTRLLGNKYFEKLIET
ncbi:MAG: CpsD/CapB family tyrosine-protein kinase, partial [Lachnospiraceae bacterium]|nr:CpsD/CapB family tyrosine-protein kinase [Lachnospiraceae bacterium]